MAEAEEEMARLESLGVAHREAGLVDDAITVFTELLLLNPQYLPPYFHLYELHQQLGSPVEAVRYLMHASAVEPGLLGPTEYCAVGAVLSGAGLWDDAATVYRRALSVCPDNQEAYELLAQIRVAQGDFAEAILILRRLLKVRPELACYTNQVHTTQTIPYRIGKIEDALEILGETLDTIGELPVETSLDVERLYLEALLVAKSGRLNEAIAMLRAVLAAGEDLGHAHLALSAVLCAHAERSRRLEFFQESAFIASSALQIQQRWPAALKILGKSLAALFPESIAGLPTAVEVFLEAIEVDPSDADNYRQLSGLYSVLGEVERASEYLHRYRCAIDEAAQRDPLGKLGVRFVSEELVTCIGHATTYADHLIKSQILGWAPERRLYVLAPSWKVANPTLLEHWNDHIQVITDPKTIKTLRPLSRALPCSIEAAPMPEGKTGHIRAAFSLAQRQWEAEGRAPLVTLDPEIREMGWSVLEAHGIPRGSWFVTAHAREANFKGEGSTSIFARHRNCDIQTYIPALEEVVARGGVGYPNGRINEFATS